MYIGKTYIKIGSFLIIHDILCEDLKNIEFYSKIKTIINRKIEENKWDWIEIIIDGIKYVNFVTKEQLKKIHYFNEGYLSGKYNDKIPEIMLKSNPISSMMLLTYINNKDNLIDFTTNLEFKNYDIILKMFELMKFLLIEIDYKFMGKLQNLYRVNGDGKEFTKLFQIPLDLCESLYQLIISECNNYYLDIYSSYALKIMANNECAVIWLKLVTKIFNIKIVRLEPRNNKEDKMEI